jgi:hypothetical protein
MAKGKAQQAVRQLKGYRRQLALIFAENLIAEQREPAHVDRFLVKRYGIKAQLAAKLREEALRALLAADESNRRERFKLVLRGMRRLYVEAFDRKQLTVCANLLSQMREMFDLKAPFVEGGGAAKSEHDDRTIDDLTYFAEHGEWPDEAKKRKSLEVVSENPLDGLT